MMLMAANKLGFEGIILDPKPMCPAHSLAKEHIIADFTEPTALLELARKSDVITYEFKKTNSDMLLSLASDGYTIYPSAKNLELIQNKYSQKVTLSASGLPVAKFMRVMSIEDMANAGNTYGYPYILKACKGRGDKPGKCVVNDSSEIFKAYRELGSGQTPLMAEQYINFCTELSVSVCRSTNGEIAVYPVAENEYTDATLRKTLVPALIDEERTLHAQSIAKRVMEVFEAVGTFCVKLFMTEDKEIFLNEVAPHPHNSGHYTIEACVCSQFENHIRAISSLPLGDTALLSPCAMINLLGKSGKEGKSGDTQLIGFENALAVKGANIHIYGKKTVFPDRKMGHITACADTRELALTIVKDAFEKIEINGK